MASRNGSAVSDDLVPENSILKAPFWPERIRVISIRQIGNNVEVQGIGLKTERYYSGILTAADLAKLKKVELRRRDFSSDADEPWTGWP